MGNWTIRVAKTKALISFAVTAKLIWAFVFPMQIVGFPMRRRNNYALCRVCTLHSIIYRAMADHGDRFQSIDSLHIDTHDCEP